MYKQGRTESFLDKNQKELINYIFEQENRKHIRKNKLHLRERQFKREMRE